VLSALVESIWEQNTRKQEAIDMQRRLVAVSRDREEEATLREMVAAHKRRDWGPRRRKKRPNARAVKAACLY
jgi:hypothetical protein